MAGRALPIHSLLTESCRRHPERMAWLARLPAIVEQLTSHWSLTIGEPIGCEDATCSWVALATTASGQPAVMKIALPHFEGEHEIAGLRFWNGDPMVRLLAADDALNAMLLERCRPGTRLQRESEPRQDAVIAGLLPRLWRKPPPQHSFRPLSTLMAHWSQETQSQSEHWPDAGLVSEGLRLMDQLSRSSDDDMLLLTDLHAANVLGAEREPWLAIDPKPFVGDRSYDATQHLLNCLERLHSDPHGAIRRFAELLGVDHERVRLWTFARLAAGPRQVWNDVRIEIARKLAC